MVAVTNTWLVESTVVEVTLKEDEVNTEPFVFPRVVDALTSETTIVELPMYSDDGKGSMAVV